MSFSSNSSSETLLEEFIDDAWDFASRGPEWQSENIPVKLLKDLKCLWTRRTTSLDADTKLSCRMELRKDYAEQNVNEQSAVSFATIQFQSQRNLFTFNWIIS